MLWTNPTMASSIGCCLGFICAGLLAAGREYMTIPHAPFELLLYGRDGRIQIRQYENLLTAVAAIDTLRPGLIRGYSLSLVLHTGTLHDASSRTEVKFVGVLKRGGET
jgi:hypothetical protein